LDAVQGRTSLKKFQISKINSNLYKNAQLHSPKFGGKGGVQGWKKGGQYV
jgi:hypothetical protein